MSLREAEYAGSRLWLPSPPEQDGDRSSLITTTIKEYPLTPKPAAERTAGRRDERIAEPGPGASPAANRSPRLWRHAAQR